MVQIEPKDVPCWVSRNDAVATLTLNRPTACNSLSMTMLQALLNHIEDLGRSTDVHCIVLAATGSVFCAGHDLKELTAARNDADRGRSFAEQTIQTCCQLMLAVTRCPKPVIASVQGTATAAGCQLVASCDLAVAARGALFSTPGVNIGLFCSTPMVALSRNLGRKAAMKMLLTGETVTADEARDLGLINSVVEEGRLVDATAELAKMIASKAPLTLSLGKAAFYAQTEMDTESAYQFATRVMVDNMMDRDASEGIQAFLDKRHPAWQLLR